MNNLSWFLYLAEVIPNIGVLLYMMAFSFMVIWGIWALVANDFCWANKPPSKVLVWIIPLMIVIAVLIPSKNTIYLIAGSEAGEHVVTSPEGQEIIDDIKTIIKSQIKEYAQ